MDIMDKELEGVEEKLSTHGLDKTRAIAASDKMLELQICKEELDLQ
jgi:hypothetical protein